MKKSTPFWILVPLALSFLTGCATTGMMTGTGNGWIYTSVKEAQLVTANQAGKRRGTSCATNILGLFATGDASLATAMKDGAITIVSSVDRESKSILGIWGKYCTIVTGI